LTKLALKFEIYKLRVVTFSELKDFMPQERLREQALLV